MQRGVAAAGLDQGFVTAVLNQPAALEGDDAVGCPNRGQPVRDDHNRAALGDLFHVLLDDPLALIVERAGGLVEDQDARIGNQRARNRDALALAA